MKHTSFVIKQHCSSSKYLSFVVRHSSFVIRHSSFLIFLFSGFFPGKAAAFSPPEYCNLQFSQLSTSWDEAIPLGDGMLGALIWQKGQQLRFSLDRADLWDLRPARHLDQPEWSFAWVQQQWQLNQYQRVQELFDAPYDNDAAPSKIPAGALEFNLSRMGEVASVSLNIENALCTVRWKNGATLETFVHAGEPVGWFRFSNLPADAGLLPAIDPPPYTSDQVSGALSPVTGQDLARLGYQKGKLEKSSQSATYTQRGWGNFIYQIDVRWQQTARTLEGCWSIDATYIPVKDPLFAIQRNQQALAAGYAAHLAQHTQWWADFWQQSAIEIPDSTLNRQWYLEQYKLGAATGNDAPPISLQAIWTADNGKLPPWKGDFHNDLNTQLSYWPTYSSNHLKQASGFIDWLELNRGEFKRYTQTYFKTDGINVPGVCTLYGEPMGGWIQYSFGPTVSCWLAHHYYLQWRYSMDREFLAQKAYPWIKDVAIYLDQIAVKTPEGKRRLPLSSSPEIFDNSRQAWFPTMTNYDLALIRWTYEKAALMAGELGKAGEAEKWLRILNEWETFDIDPQTGFTFAKDVPYAASHRHFSHLMAFHPLGLVDVSNGEKDQQIITNTLANLDKQGSDWFCGYSFSWKGILHARAQDGAGAARALRIFAENFCLKNSFHVNGDQSGKGFSKFTYRPFTLEGNFAFAAGIQEMLLQSHSGAIVLFPAIPKDWKDLTFKQLRAEGAFLISANMRAGQVTKVDILSEKGGVLKMRNPFSTPRFKCSLAYTRHGDFISFKTKPNQVIRMTNDK